MREFGRQGKYFTLNGQRLLAYDDYRFRGPDLLALQDRVDELIAARRLEPAQPVLIPLDAQGSYGSYPKA